jgi:tetratricopeptide (TPR) repeat protein
VSRLLSRSPLRQIRADFGPALIAKAIVHFHTQRYADALALFRRVLAAHPLAPSFVHAAIGMCALKLRQNETARAAFVRALEIDGGQCALALLALAAMDINSADDAVVGAALERLHRMSGAWRGLFVALSPGICRILSVSI